MTPCVPHILMTVHGSLPGAESWTCGLRTMRRGSELSVASGNALALDVANRWRTFQSQQFPLILGAGSANAGTLDGLTVRELNEEGITIAQYEGTPSTAAPTTASPATWPNQCSLVVSLITPRAGRTGRGRIYLPFIGGGSLAGGVITGEGGNTGQIATAIKTLLDGINTDLQTNFGSGIRLAVQSPKAANDATIAGIFNSFDGAPITAIKVGNVVDTQRRRRKGLNESYVTRQLA